MKKNILFAAIFAAVSFTSISVNAQEEDYTPVSYKAPAWVCEEGYWVVESNIKDKRNHTIYFYNDQKQLIGRRELTGVKLNLNRAKTKKMLKKYLEASLQAWASK